MKGESPSAGILPGFAKNPAAVYSADWCRLHMDRLSLLIEIDIKTNATDWRRWSRWRERGGGAREGRVNAFQMGESRLCVDVVQFRHPADGSPILLVQTKSSSLKRNTVPNLYVSS